MTFDYQARVVLDRQALGKVIRRRLRGQIEADNALDAYRRVEQLVQQHPDVYAVKKVQIAPHPDCP